MQVYEYQVSGKTPKYIDNDSGLIYKLFSTAEYQFYQFIQNLETGDNRKQLLS